MTIRSIGGAVMVLSVALTGCELEPQAGNSGSGGSAGGGSATRGPGKQVPVALAPPAKAPAETITLTPMKFAEIEKLIASKKGKVVVMDVWSTYCEPCMKEFPGLVAMHKKYGPEKLACISLCANYSGQGNPEDSDVMEEPLKFVKDQGATFDNILAADPDTKLYELLKIASVPAVFVYDREGKVAKIFENEAKYSEIEAFVAPLLK